VRDSKQCYVASVESAAVDLAEVLAANACPSAVIEAVSRVSLVLATSNISSSTDHDKVAVILL
jgi:hypothetical protein